MELTDSVLRDYLLGTASSEATERIEARVLEDGALFAELQSVEDDLFDACARGRLDPAERAHFMERYGHEAERLRFAGALARRTTGSASVAPAARRPWIPLAAAAALILAAGALVTRLEAPAPVVVRQQPSAPVQPVFAVTLVLGASRAAATADTITIPAGTSRDSNVQLNVQIDPADRFDKYAMDLRGAGDRVVWSGADLAAATIDGRLTVSAKIPASALAAGSYELAVHGGGTDLGFIPLTVRWSP